MNNNNDLLTWLDNIDDNYLLDLSPVDVRTTVNVNDDYDRYNDLENGDVYEW
jgi:hypothetical protein